jgi:hypothetical protein
MTVEVKERRNRIEHQNQFDSFNELAKDKPKTLEEWRSRE